MGALLESKSRTFLATTALDEFWDKTQPILFLGEWCKPYKNRDIWKNLDCEMLNSPLADLDPDEVCRYIDHVYALLLPEISHWLNKIHNAQHSLEYWDIVIGPFLFTHIQVVYDRYHRLKKAYSLYPELKTIGLTEKSFVTPLNTGEYYESTIFSDLFNLQLMTQLISLAFNSILVRKDFSQKIENRYRETNTKKKSDRLIKRIIVSLLWFVVRLRRSKVVVLLSPQDFGNKVLFRLAWSSAFRILPILPRNPAQSEALELTRAIPNLSLRSDIANLPAPDYFSRLVLELLVVNMPMSFVENYKSECVISEKCYPHYAQVVFGLPAIGREMHKLWVAKNRNKGAIQIGHQHGGGYGAMKSDSIEFVEHKFSDFFVAWGLKNKNKIIAAPSIHACLLVERKKNKIKPVNNDQILWITTEFTTYPSEIKQGIEANYNELLYHSWHSKVLSLLQLSIFSKITMRLRHTNWTDHWKYLQDEFPSLNLEKPTDKTTFYDQICSAKLLLFDNLNTTHLYGLVLNIPSILFWDESIWTIRDEVKCYFDPLRKASIFHTTPESAAAMINKVGQNPSVWWNSKEVQLARRQYCDYFLQDSKKWVQEWKKILLGFLDNKKEIKA